MKRYCRRDLPPCLTYVADDAGSADVACRNTGCVLLADLEREEAMRARQANPSWGKNIQGLRREAAGRRGGR